MKHRLATVFITLAAAFAASQSVQAARWETVATANGDRLEIDHARITPQAGGQATAWSRLNRDGIYVDDHGQRYTAIEALNRYDCAAGSFTTLQRIWRRDGAVVREEAIARPVTLAVDSGSADEKMLAAACRLPVAAVAASQKSAPAAMHADMRSAGDTAKPKTTPVADAPSAAGKPRFIELPKIDKSQLEDPGKPAAAAAPSPQAADAKATPAAKAPSAPGAAKEPKHGQNIKEVAKAAGSAAATAQTPPTPVKPSQATPAAPTIAATPSVSAMNRHELERQYATSGPRKAARRPATGAIVEHRHIHWSYEGEGAPANWAKLDPKYATCGSGRRQSPIDIREGSIKVDLEPIKFDYKWANFTVIDNGHTIQVNIGEGNTIRVLGRSYQLVQFHFHRPAEEKVRGKAFDMVAHLVHKDDDGRLAVIAVLMEKGGIEHGLIQTVWNNMPLEVGQEVAPNTTLDLNRLLPEERSYYTYMGSLTTPPCTEDVLWMVFKKPIIVSDQQVATFARLYKNNARPVQPANDRLIKESR